MDYNKIIYILVVVFIVLLIAGFAFFSTGFAKKDTAIKVISENALNDGDYFSIQLSDENSNLLANQVVNITIIDANGAENHHQVTTDESGRGMLQLNGLTAGNYNMIVVNTIYMISEFFRAISHNQKINDETMTSMKEIIQIHNEGVKDIYDMYPSLKVQLIDINDCKPIFIN